MKRLSRFKLSMLLFALALVGAISYQIIGSHIDENGVLIEPFWLIPTSWFCLFAAIISALITLLRLRNFK